MEQRDFNPVVDYRAGAFDRQTRNRNQPCDAQNKFASSGI
jgi:hypothetical protein